MEWRDEGLIIGLRRHGETSLIVELMTRGHGRHLGIVRGGRSRRMQPLMQQGNSVDALWRARLEEHLGMWQLDVTAERAGSIMGSALALSCVGLLAELLRLLPERDPHRGLYEMASAIIAHTDEPRLIGELMVRFEVALLGELGFGLDLTRCAATGVQEDLIYVSPKSGRAVCREAGQPYRERLLALPEFLLRDPGESVALSDLQKGFELSGYFLKRDVFLPRNATVPESRRSLLRILERPDEGLEK